MPKISPHGSLEESVTVDADRSVQTTESYLPISRPQAEEMSTGEIGERVRYLHEMHGHSPDAARDQIAREENMLREVYGQKCRDRERNIDHGYDVGY